MVLHSLIENSIILQSLVQHELPRHAACWLVSSSVGALAEDGRFGLRRFSGVAGYLHKGPLGAIFQVIGCLFGFFIASYTGALLTASNQPFWSDSPLIGALFLASAASTGIAALLLVLSLRRGVPSDSVENLERTEEVH